MADGVSMALGARASRAHPREAATAYRRARRTRMLLQAVALAFGPDDAASIRVVDLACGDGAMLESLAQALGPRFGWGIGLDTFRLGRPADRVDRHLYFAVADPRRHARPYPLQDASADLAIVSAPVSCRPEPGWMLAEAARLLRPGGVAILLDPCPMVARLAARTRRDRPVYNPGVWSRASIARLLRQGAQPPAMQIENFRRYGLAPTLATWQTGIEALLPEWLSRHVGSHQCLVLRRI
jgi:SAM-dependent methyltransferase